ncbi:MAG: DEAD/DEAH box helicase [Actinomycetota bacterium]|nr:MAG: DEAD/DEAH box helicase [Actinomycetota bacterium]
MSVQEDFVRRIGFELDEFQNKAIAALEHGKSVLVAAPTGSGKTIVARFAVERALSHDRRVFYTTPLKALSNQKYLEFSEFYGTDQVGLLTGDNVIRPDAKVVVMTTEVLRNMIYSSSRDLSELEYVVLDEVHYLQNPYRGAVWEEVIIHLPPEVDLVCLSATVSNAEEFAEWIGTVRGSTEAIIEEKRPVELHHFYLVGERRSDSLLMIPTEVDGRVNPEGSRFDGPGASGYSPRSKRRARYSSPRRVDVVEEFQEWGLLPAIYFIFSRNGCDEAVRQCLYAGVRLTSPTERSMIREIAESKVQALSDEDLRALGYSEWLEALESGIASHHAGLVPPFKEIVEACFARSLAKVVFATETLSLGINMPARSVVIEKLTKFNGDRHEQLSPGEYTQLAGRAGRRGIDDVGYCAVLWSPLVPFSQVASLATNRSYPLSSSFRPTYNMAANLVQGFTPETAHHLLNLSFAQYRSDAEIVHLEAELSKLNNQRMILESKASCELGSIARYLELTQAVRMGVANRMPVPKRAGTSRDVLSTLEQLSPGDVLALESEDPSQMTRAAVAWTSRRKNGRIAVGLVDTMGFRHHFSGTDFSYPPESVARIPVKAPFDPHSQDFTDYLARSLKECDLPDLAMSEPLMASAPSRTSIREVTVKRRELELLERAISGCPYFNDHVTAAKQLIRLESRISGTKTRIKSNSESLARQFDRVLAILSGRGMLDGWHLTPSGLRLARLYHECDLLVILALEKGIFDGLAVPEFAAMLSVFTFESRGPVRYGPVFPTQRLSTRYAEVSRIWGDLVTEEAAMSIPLTRETDPGFIEMAYEWATGRELSQVLVQSQMSAGDFVRNAKQVIDLARQFVNLDVDQEIVSTALGVVDATLRGVVEASSIVGIDLEIDAD